MCDLLAHSCLELQESAVSHELLKLAQSFVPGQVMGIDVGCGANLIYCLLGAKLCEWYMLGLDISREARQGAERNLAANPELSPLIQLRILEKHQEERGKFLLACLDLKFIFGFEPHCA